VDAIEPAESRALRDARTLARLSMAVARASTAAEVAQILLGELAAAVPGVSAALAVLDEPGREFELIGRRRTGLGAEFRERWSFDLPSAARDVVLSGRPMSLSRDEYRSRYPLVSSVVDPASFSRYVALPIIPGLRPIGAAGLSWADDPDLDEVDMAHLQSLVDAGAQALGRARLEDAERRTRSLLRAIVDQLPVGLLILEPGAASPVFMNRAYAEIFGLPSDPAPDDPQAIVLRPDGTPWPDDDRPLVRATFAGKVVSDELAVVEPPGRPRRSILINAWPVRDAGGRIAAGVATFVDVTARLDADAARDAFLGVLSHELRTPITSIYAGAELLQRRVVGDPEVAEITATLADEATRLHRLVENLLVLSRVERGADLQRDDPVLLHHLARRVVAYEAERWPETHFELETPSTLPAVSGDEAYAEQILRNLLSNAAKYGPPGGTVQARLEHDQDEVTLRVLDEGPGFEDDAPERLFELFYRAPAAARNAQGAGIGLYAVRALASAMHGRVWARTRPGGGAEVGVALPVYDAT
jgi:signal transduction histidine kinase